MASARPYGQYRATNPSGDGSLQVLGADGNPAGVNNARGIPLINLNSRVTKNIKLSQSTKVGVFAEFYNITNRANFGNQYFGNAFSPATYNQPSGYLGGVGGPPIRFACDRTVRVTDQVSEHLTLGTALTLFHSTDGQRITIR